MLLIKIGIPNQRNNLVFLRPSTTEVSTKNKEFLTGKANLLEKSRQGNNLNLNTNCKPSSRQNAANSRRGRLGQGGHDDVVARRHPLHKLVKRKRRAGVPLHRGHDGFEEVGGRAREVAVARVDDCPGAPREAGAAEGGSGAVAKQLVDLAEGEGISASIEMRVEMGGEGVEELGRWGTCGHIAARFAKQDNENGFFPLPFVSTYRWAHFQNRVVTLAGREGCVENGHGRESPITSTS